MTDKTLNQLARRFKVEELPHYAPDRRQYGYTHCLRTWGRGHWELHEGATTGLGDLERCELLGRYFVETGKGPNYSGDLTNTELQDALAEKVAA